MAERSPGRNDRRHVGLADYAQQNGGRKRQDDPDGCDPSGRFDIGRPFNAHKPGQDVRLAEIAEAPGADGNNAEKTDRPDAGPGVETQAAGDFRKDPHQIESLGGTAQLDHRKNGHCDQGEEDEQALDEVRPADGQKAAQKRVGNNHHRADNQRYVVIKAENGVKQLGARGKLGGGINQEKYDNENRRYNPDEMGLVAEAVFNEGRDRNRIVGALRVFSEPFCQNEPV